MGTFIRVTTSIISSIFLVITLFACGGGGDSHPPTISNLDFSPDSAGLNESGGSITVTGFVDFVDDGGDVSIITLKARDSQNNLVVDTTIPLTVNPGKSGTLQGSATVGTTAAGDYTIELFCTDSNGHSSNTLSGTFSVLESLKTTGYGNIRLRDTATGSKNYYFNVQVTNPDGTMLTDSSLIQNMKLYAYPSMKEVALTGPRVLWYSSYYLDDDGSGSNQPASNPWSEVIEYPNVSIGSLSGGFYKGVITDSVGGKHEVWLYYETPAEVTKIQGSSMGVTDNGDGTVTLSWTNPGNIDPAKHVIYVYVNTTFDSGDGYDDLLLQIKLSATESSYLVSSSEVMRLKGYPGLYWYVQIRHYVYNVTNPDSTTNNYYVYRNHSPSQALNLP